MLLAPESAFGPYPPSSPVPTLPENRPNSWHGKQKETAESGQDVPLCASHQQTSIFMTVSLYSQDSIVINSSYLEDTEGHPSSPFVVLCGFDPTNPGGSDLPAISPF